VGDVEGGDLEARQQLHELRQQPGAQPTVEGGERLVEEQEPGLGGERPGQRDPLLLAAREAADGPTALAVEPDERQDLARAGCDRSAAPALHSQAEADVGGDVEVREEGVVLEHEPHPASVGRHAGERAPAPGDAPRRRVDEPGHGPQERRLAAPARPEQADHLACGHGEVDPVHHPPPAELHDQALDAQPGGPDRRWRLGTG
jgi:hypothetical protein